MNRRAFLKAGMVGAAAASMSFSGADRLLYAQTTATTPVYRTLGRTGLRITAVGYGTDLTSEYEVIRAGVDMGINYLDTARRYLHGRGEEIVSRAVEGIRDKVYIATKTHGATKDAVLDDVEASLKSLRTDHVDVLHLHGLTDPKRAFDPEIRGVLVKLKEQGKVRFFGVSTHTNQAEVVNGIINDPDRFFDVVLVGYNFKSNPSVTQAIARAAKAGIGVIAMKTQAGGYRTTEMGSASPHQAALKWVLQDTNVTAAIPGMKTLDELRELVAVMGMKLTAADERVLRRYSQAIDPYYCRLCGECEKTCPNGVEISVVNRALMYAEGYEEHALAKATFHEASAASRCLACGECVARCVNGLRIAEKMRRARSLFAKGMSMPFEDR
jgi:predicted aldo/keto reductase-like oxidoreductase